MYMYSVDSKPAGLGVRVAADADTRGRTSTVYLTHATPGPCPLFGGTGHGGALLARMRLRASGAGPRSAGEGRGGGRSQRCWRARSGRSRRHGGHGAPVGGRPRGPSWIQTASPSSAGLAPPGVANPSGGPTHRGLSSARWDGRVTPWGGGRPTLLPHPLLAHPPVMVAAADAAAAAAAAAAVATAPCSHGGRTPRRRAGQPEQPLSAAVTAQTLPTPLSGEKRWPSSPTFPALSPSQPLTAQ